MKWLIGILFAAGLGMLIWRSLPPPEEVGRTTIRYMAWVLFILLLAFTGIQFWQEKLTVSIGLRLFQDQYGQTNLPLLMAASLLHIAPVVVIFLIGQRYFIKGIVMTGLKG